MRKAVQRFERSAVHGPRDQRLGFERLGDGHAAGNGLPCRGRPRGACRRTRTPRRRRRRPLRSSRGRRAAAPRSSAGRRRRPWSRGYRARAGRTRNGRCRRTRPGAAGCDARTAPGVPAESAARAGRRTRRRAPASTRGGSTPRVSGGMPLLRTNMRAVGVTASSSRWAGVSALSGRSLRTRRPGLPGTGPRRSPLAPGEGPKQRSRRGGARAEQKPSPGPGQAAVG